MGEMQDVPLEVTRYLLQRGVRRVLSGHKPCGDSPFVAYANSLELIMCDTTYSDHTAQDKRGDALATVEVAYDGHSSCAILKGTLRDGANYCFRLPVQGPSAPTLEKDVDGISEDRLVGHKTPDGWWIKAVCIGDDCHYHCALAEEGGRHVQYKRVAKPELEAMFAGSASCSTEGNKG
eukprot:497788-Amphidinium_carterae.1